MINTLLLKYNIHKLTQATCRIKDELHDSTTAYILITIDTTVLENDMRSACDCINIYTITCSAVDVVVTAFEHRLKEIGEHNELNRLNGWVISTQ